MRFILCLSTIDLHETEYFVMPVLTKKRRNGLHFPDSLHFADHFSSIKNQ
jgi:hypothetical protein